MLVESYTSELEEEQDIWENTTILENTSSQPNEQNQERLVEICLCEIKEEQDISDEVTILEDVWEGSME